MMDDGNRTVARHRVVVIDDDPDVRDVMSEVLHLANYAVVVMPGELPRVDEVAAERPDLVVLDLLLSSVSPHGNRWAHVGLLRSHPELAEVPILVVSADVAALRGRLAEIHRDPLVSVLEKPFSVDQFEWAVAARLHGIDAWDGEDPQAIVLVADAEARLVSASPAALELLGMDPNELRLRKVADIVTHSADWARAEWEGYVEARRWEGPVTLRLADGRELPAYSHAEIVSEGGADLHVSRLRVPRSVPPS